MHAMVWPKQSRRNCGAMEAQLRRSVQYEAKHSLWAQAGNFLQTSRERLHHAMAGEGDSNSNAN
jgi:hypothetical protein